MVRSTLPTSRVASIAQEVSRAVDPAFTPPLVESFATMIDRVLAEQRLFARLSGVFAAVAALLAGIGIYAMMAGSVAERRKEFGIRLALGASGIAVQRLVLRTAIVLGVFGTAIGLAAGTVLKRAIESRLFGVTALDPIVLASASAGIVALCIAASLLPAMRAARVDPVRSLRAE